MTEELEVLTIVAGRFEATGIAYMVTGSFAANYYAVPRMTRDIDLVVELSAGDADRFCAPFEGDFDLDPDAVRTAITERGAFNLIHLAHVVKVDCIVRKDSAYRRMEFARQRCGSCASTGTSSTRSSGRGFWRGWAGRGTPDPRRAAGLQGRVSVDGRVHRDGPRCAASGSAGGCSRAGSRSGASDSMRRRVSGSGS